MLLQTGHTIIFQLKQIVFLKTDIDQLPRIVTGYSLRPNNAVSYYLSQGTSETIHYEFEISPQKDELMTLNINTSEN